MVDRLIPPHPARVLSCGCGLQALVLAILDGDHALYKVGKRLEKRSMMALLQPGLTRASQCWRGKGVSSPRGAALAPSPPAWPALGWPTTPLFAPAWLKRDKLFSIGTKCVRPVHGPPGG